MRLAIFAALPHEAKKIVTNLKAKKDAEERTFDIYRANCRSIEILVVITGMGTINALSAAKYISSVFRPEIILSVGFGGALYEAASIGDLIWGSKFISVAAPVENESNMPDAGKHIASTGNENTLSILQDLMQIREGSVVTIPYLMKKSEIRKAIPGEIQNPVCDMETFALAHFCEDNGLRFFAVRSITDLANEDIPAELGEISDSSGKYSVMRALIIFVTKPCLLPVVFRLAANSQIASRTLCSFVRAFLDSLQ